MPILQEATDEQLAELLDLFPVSHLRETWPKIKEKKKDVLCAAVAALRNYTEITNFVDAHFSCAKQHVYVFNRPEGAVQLPATVLDGERIKHAAGRALYVASLVRGVVLQNPLEHTTITFLWPLKIEVTAAHVVVRFVVLEKNISARFDRPSYAAERGIEESDILNSIGNTIELIKCDLHKGVKELMSKKRKFMDAFHSRYKTPKLVGSVTMNEEKGIRENDPELFETLMKSPLSQTIFKLAKNKEISSVDALSVDPTSGTLSFHRYSESIGDTDRVIREILKNN